MCVCERARARVCVCVCVWFMDISLCLRCPSQLMKYRLNGSHRCISPQSFVVVEALVLTPILPPLPTPLGHDFGSRQFSLGRAVGTVSKEYINQPRNQRWTWRREDMSVVDRCLHCELFVVRSHCGSSLLSVEEGVANGCRLEVSLPQALVKVT